MPIDPLSGGTWIAASDAGLILTLLNVYETPFAGAIPKPRPSRGAIIPQLLDAATLAEAFERTKTLDVSDLPAFRLLLADPVAYAEFYFTGKTSVRTGPTPRQGPLLFTSSGLGDALVDPPRRALFNEVVTENSEWRDKQDAFHRHSWPDRRHLSVCMSRPEARTVSYTVVELEEISVRMIYHPEAPDQPAQPFDMKLDCS
jgi:hypothetical protein